MRLHELGQDRADLGAHLVVLADDLVQLVEVALVLVLLDEHGLGGLEQLHAVALEHLGLADQLEDDRVEVDHDQLLAVRARHRGEHRRLQLGLVVLHCGEELHDDLDLLLDQDLDHVVVGAHDRVVLELEQLDGLVRTPVEVLQPQHLLGLHGHVADLVVGHDRVQHGVLDFGQHLLVGLDDLRVLGLEVLLERGALEDVAELLVEADLLLDGAHGAVAGSDVVLDLALLLGDLDGEADVVLVELGVVDDERALDLDLALEAAHVFVERLDVVLVDVVVLERVDLLLDEEDLDELAQLALERVEGREDLVDLVLLEVEVVVVAELVVGRVLAELLALGGVQRDALLEDLDEVFNRRVLPELRAVLGPRVDEQLAAGDHLVGQLAEQLHDVLLVQLVLVDVVDHADRVQQQRQLLLHHRRARLLELLDLALELHQLLVVVLRLGELAVELVLEFLVLLLLALVVGLVAGDLLGDLLLRGAAAARGVLAERARGGDQLLEQVVDQLVVGRVELLLDGVELVVALLPVVHLVAQPALLVELLVVLLAVLDDAGHGAQPAVDRGLDVLEQALVLVLVARLHARELRELVQLLLVRLLEQPAGVVAQHLADGRVLGLDLLQQLRRDAQLDLRLRVLDALDHVVVEAAELVQLLLLGALLAGAPLSRVHLPQEGQEAVVRERLQRVRQVLVQLAVRHQLAEVLARHLVGFVRAHELQRHRRDPCLAQVDRLQPRVTVAAFHPHNQRGLRAGAE